LIVLDSDKFVHFIDECRDAYWSAHTHIVRAGKHDDVDGLRRQKRSALSGLLTAVVGYDRLQAKEAAHKARVRADYAEHGMIIEGYSLHWLGLTPVLRENPYHKVTVSGV
jgi:hypothetical protein